MRNMARRVGARYASSSDSLESAQHHLAQAIKSLQSAAGVAAEEGQRSLLFDDRVEHQLRDLVRRVEIVEREIAPLLRFFRQKRLAGNLGHL